MTEKVISKVIKHLRFFMPETLAKRIVSMVLLAVGVPNKKVTELTGLCDKSVRVLKKSLEGGDIDKQFHVGGGGRKSKLGDVESEVVAEIERNDYHNRQQIADMILEKHGIKVSLPVVGKLLKKTRSSV